MGVDELRTTIEKTISKEEYIRAEIPLSFLFALDIFLQTDREYLTLKNALLEVEGTSLTSKNFNFCLEFLNTRGMICYFSKPKSLSDFIIVQPQWLVDGISAVIFDPNFHRIPESSPEYSVEMREFIDTRKLSEALLADIWNNEGYIGEVQEFFRNLMLETLLMCQYSWKNDESLTFYLVPSLFDVSETIENEKVALQNGFTGPFFAVDFSGDYGESDSRAGRRKLVKLLPIGFFERLVCDEKCCRVVIDFVLSVIVVCIYCHIYSSCPFNYVTRIDNSETEFAN